MAQFTLLLRGGGEFPVHSPKEMQKDAYLMTRCINSPITEGLHFSQKNR
jgi:hypothetical protein